MKGRFFVSSSISTYPNSISDPSGIPNPSSSGGSDQYGQSARAA